MGLLVATEHRFAIIIGAGIAGIVTGCEFIRGKSIPLEDFQILDRYSGFGGVWWKNTYPGAACDVLSYTYQISWAPNAYWSRRFAGRQEIQRYFEKVARSHHLDESTSFDTNVESAMWDEQQMCWVIETKDLKTGATKIWTCNILVSAAGTFSVPQKADIEGLDLFENEQWHINDWPSHADLAGKRVAIIGTGPSAGQVIPRICDAVKSLTVYQRHPGHCVPRGDAPIPPSTVWLFVHFPILMTLYIFYLKQWTGFIGRNVFVPGSWLQGKAVEAAHSHLTAQVPDDSLRQKLWSDDNFGCKRPLVLDDYYPVFNEPHVELVTDPVVGLSTHGVLSQPADLREPQERPADVLIWATGYRANEFGICFPARGRARQLLADKYGAESRSLYGVAVDDFPNLFTILGPNSISIQAGIVEQMEVQAKYIAAVAKYVRAKNMGSRRYAVVADAERVRSWTETLREGQTNHVATGEGCQTNTYFRTKSDMVYSFPYRYSQYRKLMRSVDFKNDWLLLSKDVGQGVATVSRMA